MVGCVRLYLEPKPGATESKSPTTYTPVIDCNPEQARELRRRLQRQGYIVHAFPI
jgi:hypothetical protein